MKQYRGKSVGKVFDIHRMSTHDGPGLRTTIFLKGCPLHCLWCHNPESIDSSLSMGWEKKKCIGCGICIETCKQHALSFESEGLLINKNLCIRCGECAITCPSKALESIGVNKTVQEVMKVFLKDKLFYKNSGGGVTISGGEPGIQPEFVVSLLQECKKYGLHTAVDTSGFVKSDFFDQILPYVDLILYDIKEMMDDKHKKFTGRSNEKILNNVKCIDNYIKEHNNKPELWIRTPLIPGATATKENVIQIGEFIKENINSTVSRWELCAFNTMCKAKYKKLGIKWDFEESELLSSKFIKNIEYLAKSTGVNSEIIYITGLTKNDSNIKD